MMANILPAFDPDFASPSEWAAMYRACGLQVVPARFPMRTKDDKRPNLASWREFHDRLAPDAVFESWFSQSATQNMGVVTGACSGRLMVVDIDDYKGGPGAEWWRSVTFGIEPETPMQVTGGGGRQYLFRLPDGVEISTYRTPIADIRCQGGFAMLPPSQHMNGKNYAWAEHRAPWEIEVDVAPQRLIDAVIQLIEDHRGSGPVGDRDRTTSPQADYDGFGRLIDGRESYMRDVVWGAVLNLHRRLDGTAPDEKTARDAHDEAFETYLRKVRTRIPNIDNAEGLEKEGRGSSAFFSKWQHEMRRWNGKVAQEAAKRPFEEAAELVPASQPALVDPTDSDDLIPVEDVFPIDASGIPTRDWIIPGVLLRRYLSVLVAPPGSGKSLLTLQLAITTALGNAWGGWSVRSSARTLVINAEDDTDEMKRRLWASAKAMGVDQGDLAGRLFLAKAPESIVIAKTDGKTKTVCRTPLVEKLIRTVTANKIDVIIVDPFAETFEGDENNNSEVKWAGILWREVARRTGASVLLVHHTRKYASAMAGDADASRGGGALIGTARIVSTLFAMTDDEAAAMNVAPEHRTRYVRFDDAKANLSLVTGVAKWFEKVSITLPNGSGLLPGDEVGALVPWRPPGVFEGVSIDTLRLILETIDRGCLDQDGQPTGHFWTASANGSDKSRWVGTLISNHLGCEADKAKNVIKEWLGTGLLSVFEYDDPRGRQARKGVRSDPSKWPGRSS